MSTYDVAPDDEPLDIVAVTADDRLVEELRQALDPDAAVVSDDDDDELDPAVALLRTLQIEVGADLQEGGPILPPGLLELAPGRRRLGRGATIAVVAASVLSLGGVAAASAPGQPLAGVRSAVSTAVSDVVDAITPSSPTGSAQVASTHSPKPTPRPTPPGDAVSAAARSAAAVRQITANLDRAAVFLDAGKYTPAKEQLDAAERKLVYVSDPAVKAPLAARLASLRVQLATNPSPKPSHAAQNGTSERGGKGHSGDPGATNDNSGKGSDGQSRVHGASAAPSHGARPDAKPTAQPAHVSASPMKVPTSKG
ncbi:MAG: hypothetical protein JWO88_16 [Frankiales bacterium]|nr:hypothetical protein [Frankiales bacterium]